ncbi:hypothetical protein [Streptococcus parasuis]|uniref:hypothetical protein n=1 Tax=Streptococcus parasuis TaxID=1501662 RepID=UPI002412700F|nr:hypothetical protein [Streptococcus parasuis]MDG4477768.1 TMCO4 family protein [Streptococcus parasuis]
MDLAQPLTPPTTTPKTREAKSLFRNWGKALKEMYTHVCKTAKRVKKQVANYVKKIDWKKVAVTAGAIGVGIALTVATGGLGAPVAMAIGGAASGAIISGYDAYSSGQRGWALAGSTLKGAGLGAITGFVGGQFIGAGANVAANMTQNITNQTVRHVVSAGVEAGVETAIDTGISLATGNPISLKNVATDYGLNLITNGSGSVSSKKSAKADINTSKPKGGDVPVKNSRNATPKTPESIIADRVEGLDLTPHQTPYSQLSKKKATELRQKVKDRTITQEEYKRLDWNNRFQKRRKEGVDNFWLDERKRLMNGEEGTRIWSSEQQEQIISGRRPQFEGKTLHGHHTYNASQYPHLANNPNIIYPATYNEHLNGWHGGSWRKILPGERINKISDF